MSNTPVDTSFYHYKAKRGEQAELKTRIKEIAQTRGALAIGVSTCCCGVKAGL